MKKDLVRIASGLRASAHNHVHQLPKSYNIFDGPLLLQTSLIYSVWNVHRISVKVKKEAAQQILTV